MMVTSTTKWRKAMESTNIVMEGRTKVHGRMIYKVVKDAKRCQMDKFMKESFTKASGMVKVSAPLRMKANIKDSGVMV